MRDLTVIFDLDDTLYPERQYALSGFRAAARWASQTLRAPNLYDDLVEHLDAGHLGKVFPMVLGKHVPAHTREDLAGFIEAYRNNEPALELSLFEDAHWALEHYGRFATLGLITDGDLKSQQRKVSVLGIGHRFSEIIYTGAFGPGYRKPHPRAFEAIQEALGGEAHNFVYVGDNPGRDFVAPNARGWRTVWVVRPGGIHDGTPVADGGSPQETVRSLHELPQFLGA